MTQENIYLLTLCLPLATILIVFAMRYVAMVQQSRSRAANDNAYRLVAEKSVVLQSEMLTALSGVQAVMADVQSRLIAVEKILKAVE
jgi:hypothetical protein